MLQHYVRTQCQRSYGHQPPDRISISINVMLMSPRQPVAYWTYLIRSRLFSTSLNHMTVSNSHTHILTHTDAHTHKVKRCYLFVDASLFFAYLVKMLIHSGVSYV